MDGSIRVLHVDDDPEFTTLTARFLERADDRITVASEQRASNGLDALDGGDFDCVVSDYDMPGMDGLEFLEAVREAYPELPFVLFTGRGSERVASDAISHGATDYLQKEPGTDQYDLLANRIVNVATQYRIERAERSRRQRRKRQREALVELATDEAVTTGDFDTAAERITETAADVLSVDRVNVWLFDDDALTCVDHYDRPTDTHDGGTSLATDQHPDYFTALETSRVLDVDDVHSDPRTVELREYFDAHDVRGVLDATLWSEGDVVGVVCHEAVEEPRTWTDDEVQFAGNVADVVHRALRNEERIARRREIEFQRSLLKAQQEAVLDGMLVVDDEGTPRSYNDQFVEMWDVEAPDLDDGRPLLDRVTERLTDPNSFRERVESLRDAPVETARDELELDDGRAFEWYSTPVTADDGAHYGRLWMFRDITQRTVREQRLAETTARLEALFENSPDMINVHDTDGNLIDPNPRLCEKTGYDADELAEMKVWDLDRAVDPDEARAMWESMETGDRFKVEAEYERRDGSTFPAEVHFRCLDLKGKDRFVAISRDVTERKQRERELKRQNERLEEFASVVSHDLRNPLNVARARLELAEMDCACEHVEGATSAVERSLTLVENLLDLARDGDDVGDLSSVDVEAAVRDCWESVDTADASLVVDADLTIRADRVRFQQVLENLVRNAVEHGGGDVTITLGELDDDTGFYLADDGVGIPADDRERVLDLGYSTSANGHGFGLSIVRDVAAAHGWTVDVRDSDDGGARFELRDVEVP